MSNAAESGEGVRDVGILFVDLVDSSVFASVLGIKEYADFLGSFHEVCLLQCRHFFSDFLEGKYRERADWTARIVGDELLVFLHTGRAQNDVYLLTCLAVMVKTAWLGAATNVERAKRRTPLVEISAGVHHGPVWSVPSPAGPNYSGYAINLAKRIEGYSRAGERYRIFLSDQAFKLVHNRQRNLLFGSRRRFEAKGIFALVGVYELAHSFVNPRPRLAPELLVGITEVLVDSIRHSSQDLWIHDVYQLWSEDESGVVTEEAQELCSMVLHHSPRDPIALYHLAQASLEKGDLSIARLLLQDLTAAWPQFGDGFLELGRVFRKLGDSDSAQDAFRRAHLLGVEEAADALRSASVVE